MKIIDMMNIQALIIVDWNKGFFAPFFPAIMLMKERRQLLPPTSQNRV